MISKRFGKLTVIKKVESRRGRTCYLCLCECGNEKVVLAQNLKGKHTKSCGCLHLGINNLKHGMRKSSEYNSWVSMKTRCYYLQNEHYKDYGGRGVKVCDRWRNSFENFFADMGEKPSNHSIDRVDNSGNYEKSNCKWSTQKEQTRNTRRNKIVEYKGKKMCLAEAVEKYSRVKYGTVTARLNRGWSIGDAMGN